MEDLFYQANVDLYLSGHIHAYERLYPIYDGEVDANGYNNPRGFLLFLFLLPLLPSVVLFTYFQTSRR